MSTLADKLETVHARASHVLFPFTMMIIKRSYSPSRLRAVADELEKIVAEMRSIADGK